MSRSWWLIAASITVLGGIGYGIYYTHVMHRVSAALQPCWSAMGNPSHSVSETRPCYENALRIDPGNNWLRIRFAEDLTNSGEFSEAKPLYEEVANVPGLYQAEARRELVPGNMQITMKSTADWNRTRYALDGLYAQDAAEEKSFLKQHAQVSNGEITAMSEPYKQQWLQMRTQHAQDQRKLEARLHN